ncbi:bacteriochlorophyll 4-vinyl reductase [Pseudonocardia sp. MH-G8]|nr:Nramp family divalent metal transporter [Pseudonocardia sp. MH-G8]OZM76803.1 bacteriochlorophyll 4-vinyl reductase [Pseudonocardia sp. MH-G8]
MGTTQATWWQKVALFGPGLALAATSVGAGDLVSTLEGAGSFGMGLVWIAVVGVVIKYVLTEASGRLQLSSPTTLMAKIASIHIGFAWLFLVAVVAMTTLYGAGLGSVAALALEMMIPGLPAVPTTIAIILISGAIVYVGKYDFFEKYMVGFSVVMFLGVVVIAIFAAGAMEEPATIVETLTISIPGGSFPAALAMIGGIGGSATIAIYAYWVRDKGWTDIAYLTRMRKDAAVSYAAILVFVLSLSTVGTALVFGTGLTISGNAELEALGAPLQELFGQFVRVTFFVTFFVVVFSSIVGGFNGFCYMLADCIRVVRRIPDDQADEYIAPKRPFFTAVLAFQVLAPLVIMFAGRPVQLVLAYAISGAFFLPLLVVAFLILLGRRRVSPELRNSKPVTVVLVMSLVLFGSLAISQTVGQLAG